ncbi:MAG: type II toxin-antitoxin system RelE/ParE family toxin [Candidatus Tritonobacter lacicola]|nr:type II toxin-antitoxin system RelE/ParE family toxin [Candidatus Tritonobacter lacicola]
MSKDYKLVLTPQAHRMYKKLTAAVKSQCLAALDRIKKDPSIGKPLLYHLKGYLSFGTASYRIVYKVELKRILVIVVAIGHRREIYDKLKKLLK